MRDCERIGYALILYKNNIQPEGLSDQVGKDLALILYKNNIQLGSLLMNK